MDGSIYKTELRCMLWNMIFPIIMSRDIEMAGLRIKILLETEFYLKHPNSYRKKCLLLKNESEKITQELSTLKNALKKLLAVL